MTSRLWSAATVLCVGALVAAGCDAETTVLDACPLLGPGSLADFETIDLGAAQWASPGAIQHGAIAAGSLVLVPFFSAGDENISFELNASRSAAVFVWGPRDSFGGYPHCLALGRGAATFKATSSGEYLIGIGPWAGESTPIAADSLGWAAKRDGAATTAVCATLAAQGCGNARCDGELARDAAGCLTCECLDGALCGPERSAGPAGSCILPACHCDDLSAGPVCGADGATWPSACDAACAGVPVIKEGACEAACPALAACQTPCFGLRDVDLTTGCPSCGCLGTFAQNAASCAACPLDPEPVCGSDGRTWPNRCRARCGGARILYAGSCNPTCRSAPEGCTLDCAFGLLPSATVDAAGCLECRCAPTPTLDCADFGANACAVVGGDPWAITTPNACVAAAIGASSGQWGACAVACETDEDCRAFPSPDDDAWTSTELRCLQEGFFGGRCFSKNFAKDDCGCGALVDPVCGGDDHTYLNLCRLRCVGVDLAHLGACCEAPDPVCPEGQVPDRDARGCAASDGRCLAAADATAGRACAGNAAVAAACTRDGQSVTTSACDAALRGLDARPEYCR